MRRLARILIGLGLLSVTWTSAGFEVAAGATVSDVFLAAGASLGFFAVRGRALESNSQLNVMGLAVVLVVLGGVLGAVATSRPVAATDIVAFVLASGSAALLYRTIPPSGLTLAWLIPPLLAGLWINAIYGLLVEPTFASRSSGLSVHPNTFGFAGFMMVAFGFAILVGRSGRWQLIAMASLPVGTVSTLQSGSRAALGAIALSAAMAACVVIRRRPISESIRWVLVGLFVVGVSFNQLSETVGYQRLLGDSSSAAASDLGRAELRASSAELIDSSPFFGSGFQDGLAAHSVPLQLWQIAGILGLFALVLLAYLLAIRPILVDFRSPRSRHSQSLALSTVGPPLVLWMVFSNALWEGEFWIVLALVAAGASAPSRRRPSLTSDHLATASSKVSA